MTWGNDAVGAAIIAGTASLMGLLIGKESKVSEFRQEWINGLRDDVTSLVANALTLQAADKITPEHDPVFLELHKTTTRIALRLNPAENESKDLLKSMADLRSAIHSPATFEEVEPVVQQLQEKTQSLLKKEWNRVKSGEPFYRWTRRFLLVAVLPSSLRTCTSTG